VGGLARAAGVPRPRGPLDLELGRYLVFSGPIATKAGMARNLINEGIDPLALDGIEQVVPRLRLVRRRTWPLGPPTALREHVIEEASLL
jgi:hypothetical protein